MSDTIIIILTAVCIVTYAFEIVFGLAGTIMLFVIMGAFIDAKHLIVYSAMPQLMVASIGLWKSPRTVERTVLTNMLIFALLGSTVGMALFYLVDSLLLELLLALFITGCGIYIVTAPVAHRLKKTTRHSLDFIAGISQQMFGISGPIAMTRIMGSYHDKTVVRNYALAFFLSLNIVRIIYYIIFEFSSPEWQVFTPSILKAMAISAPFLLVSLLYANHLHFKIRQDLFRKVLAWVILFGGLYMLFNWFTD